jgi:hypothetical protein
MSGGPSSSLQRLHGAWLDAPPSDRKAFVACVFGAAFRADRRPQKPFRKFLRDCTERRDGAQIQSSTLFAAYSAWSRRVGAQELSVRAMAEQLTRLDYRSKKSNTIFWLGLQLKEPPAAPENIRKARR